MYSISIYNHLQNLKNLPSTKDKIRYLKGISDPAEIKYFTLTYDKSINFWITYTAIPDTTIGSSDGDIVDLMTFLESNNTGKIRGKALTNMLASHIDSTSEQFTYIVQRLIDRDLRCGVNKGIIDKAWPSVLISNSYCRCSVDATTNKSKISKVIQFPAYLDEKVDGMFVNVILNKDDDVMFMSRSGSELYVTYLPLIEDLYELLGEYTSVVLTGELVVYNNDVLLPRKEGNGIINSCTKSRTRLPEGYTIQVKVWDRLPYIDWQQGRCEIPLEQRRNALHQLIVDNVTNGAVIHVETHTVHSMQDVNDIYRKMVSDGGEGAVLKNITSAWYNGTHKEWFKIKEYQEFEVEVVGINFSNKPGRASTFKSVIVKSSDGKLNGQVSGFDNKDLVTFREYHDSGELVGRIITVGCNAIFKDGESYSMAHGRFIEDRQDKLSADNMVYILNLFNNVTI